MLGPLSDFISVAGVPPPAVQHLTPGAGGGRQGQSIKPEEKKLFKVAFMHMFY